jgi:hypothetical protein
VRLGGVPKMLELAKSVIHPFKVCWIRGYSSLTNRMDWTGMVATGVAGVMLANPSTTR